MIRHLILAIRLWLHYGYSWRLARIVARQL